MHDQPCKSLPVKLRIHVPDPAYPQGILADSATGCIKVQFSGLKYGLNYGSELKLTEKPLKINMFWRRGWA
jgi:hypothetical protein